MLISSRDAPLTVKLPDTEMFSVAVRSICIADLPHCSMFTFQMTTEQFRGYATVRMDAAAAAAVDDDDVAAMMCRR